MRLRDGWAWVVVSGAAPARGVAATTTCSSFESESESVRLTLVAAREVALCPRRGARRGVDSQPLARKEGLFSELEEATCDTWDAYVNATLEVFEGTAR